MNTDINKSVVVGWGWYMCYSFKVLIYLKWTYYINQGQRYPGDIICGAASFCNRMLDEEIK